MPQMREKIDLGNRSRLLFLIRGWIINSHELPILEN